MWTYCRLCVNSSDDIRSFYDENDQPNVLHGIVVKYFHPTILNIDKHKELSGICRQCRGYLLEFLTFQTYVYDSQAKLVDEMPDLVDENDDHVSDEEEAEKKFKDLLLMGEFISMESTKEDQCKLQNIEMEGLAEEDDVNIEGVVQEFQAIGEMENEEAINREHSAIVAVPLAEDNECQASEIIASSSIVRNDMELIDVEHNEVNWNADPQTRHMASVSTLVSELPSDKLQLSVEDETVEIEPSASALQDDMEFIDVEHIDDSCDEGFQHMATDSTVAQKHLQNIEDNYIDDDGWNEEMPSVSGYTTAANFSFQEQDDNTIHLPQVSEETEIINSFMAAENIIHDSISNDDISLDREASPDTIVLSDASDIEDEFIARVLTKNRRYVDIEFRVLAAKFLTNIKCYECCVHVKNLLNLYEHFRDKHPKVNMYVMCCEQKFIKHEKLKKHLILHSKYELNKQSFGTNQEEITAVESSSHKPVSNLIALDNETVEKLAEQPGPNQEEQVVRESLSRENFTPLRRSTTEADDILAKLPSAGTGENANYACSLQNTYLPDLAKETLENPGLKMVSRKDCSIFKRRIRESDDDDSQELTIVSESSSRKDYGIFKRRIRESDDELTKLLYQEQNFVPYSLLSQNPCTSLNSQPDCINLKRKIIERENELAKLPYTNQVQNTELDSVSSQNPCVNRNELSQGTVKPKYVNQMLEIVNESLRNLTRRTREINSNPGRSSNDAAKESIEVSTHQGPTFVSESSSQNYCGNPRPRVRKAYSIFNKQPAPCQRQNISLVASKQNPANESLRNLIQRSRETKLPSTSYIFSIQKPGKTSNDPAKPTVEVTTGQRPMVVKESSSQNLRLAARKMHSVFNKPPAPSHRHYMEMNAKKQYSDKKIIDLTKESVPNKNSHGIVKVVANESLRNLALKTRESQTKLPAKPSNDPAKETVEVATDQRPTFVSKSSINLRTTTKLSAPSHAQKMDASKQNPGKNLIDLTNEAIEEPLPNKKVVGIVKESAKPASTEPWQMDHSILTRSKATTKFKCNQCDQLFNRYIDLSLHRLTHRMQKSQSVHTSTNVTRNISFRHICIDCRRIFYTRNDLNEHRCRHPNRFQKKQ